MVKNIMHGRVVFVAADKSGKKLISKKEKNKSDSIAAKSINRLRSFRYMLILEGALTGALSSAAVVFFRVMLEKADELRKFIIASCTGNVWLTCAWLALLAALSFAVYFLVKYEPYISGSGIPQVEGEMAGCIEQNWFRVLICKLAGGIISVGCGLSLGREGPSIQLGAMTAKGFAKLTKRVKTEERHVITCGAGAGLAAAFNAPLAGVLFCLEEMHKNFSAEVILSVMASSVTADFISSNVFGLEPVFAFSVPHMMPLGMYGHVVALGLILGLFGALYNKSIGFFQNMYIKIPPCIRLLVPFLCAGALGFVLPQILGGGHALAMQVSAGTYALGFLCLLLAAKFVFSMLSFGSGAPGGIFLPLLVMGAMTGAIYFGAADSFFKMDASLLSNFIILGMAGYFSAIVRAPITGIILISEMTGSFSHLLTLSVVSLFAYTVPDLMKVKPIYEQLLERILAGKKHAAVQKSEKVLVESVLCHGCAAQNCTVGDIDWPEGCLVVSVVRMGEEIVPKGNTLLCAGDMISLLCDTKTVFELKKMLELKCESVVREK